MFHDHKHIQDAKGGRDDHAEITGHDCLGMVAHKRSPACGVGGSSWFDVALMIEGQLLTQKEVLRGEGWAGAQAQEQEAPRINEEYHQRARKPDDEAEQARESSHSQGIPPKYR